MVWWNLEKWGIERKEYMIGNGKENDMKKLVWVWFL